jgi:hypothetical protein
MISQDFTSSITERTKVSIKSGNSTGIDCIGELNLSEAKVSKIVCCVIENHVAVPVLDKAHVGTKEIHGWSDAVPD